MVKGVGEAWMILAGGGGVMLLPLYICILLTVSRVQRKNVYITIVLVRKTLGHTTTRALHRTHSATNGHCT